MPDLFRCNPCFFISSKTQSIFSMDIIRFIKNWTLPIAMILGVILYFAYASLQLPIQVRHFTSQTVNLLQPLLIFSMLFLTFCKVNVSELKPCRWHLSLLLIQSLSFIVLAALLYLFPDTDARILVEGTMLCLICPTATAAAVVTGKLGGSAAHLTSYTILINIVNAVLVPLIVPVIHPQEGVMFVSSFLIILGKVLPLLLCPFILAVVLRALLPKVHAFFGRYHGISFYLWAVALTLAIAVTVKSIVHSEVSIWYQAGLAAVSLVTCVLQFYIGKRIGRKHDDSISAGQALGQKNTVLAIWMGYTFFTPVTSVAMGFYSVWHNVFNSYQLYLQRKKDEKGTN